VQDGREAVLGPGDFALYETARPFRWSLRGEWELLVLTWPRAGIALDDAVSQQLTARALGGGDGLGAIVARMLRDLVVAPPQLSAAGGVRLATRWPSWSPRSRPSACRPPAGPGRRRPAAPHRRPDRRAPRRPGPRSGHRGRGALRVHPAPAPAVRPPRRHGRPADPAERLERCRRELLDPRCADRSITEVSRRWGFADLPAFSRAFRAAYGTSPREWRARRSG
jgi:hypothetical protein